MESTRARISVLRPVLCVAAIIALLAALVLPQTHRIAHEQIAFVLPVAPPVIEPVRQLVGGRITPGVKARMANYAAEHPDDDAMQTALATLGPLYLDENPMRASVRHLAPLLDRYPRSVIIRAAVLRYTMAPNGRNSIAPPRRAKGLIRTMRSSQ
jgi:hypothetical protein